LFNLFIVWALGNLFKGPPKLKACGIDRSYDLIIIMGSQHDQDSTPGSVNHKLTIGLFLLPQYSPLGIFHNLHTDLEHVYWVFIETKLQLSLTS